MHLNVASLCTLLCASSLAGCNSGLAALVGLSNSDSEDPANTAPSVGAFLLEDAAQSPATIRFRLVDPEGDPATVSLYYQTIGEPPQLLTQLIGGENEASYATNGNGLEHVLSWHFTGETGLPRDGSYVPDVQVYATLAAGAQSITPGINAAIAGVGNDAPEVQSAVPPTGETVGVVPVALAVADTSADLVNVRVEYDLQNDFPDAGWRLARPSLADSTPEFAITDLVTDAGGVEAAFFWDTNVDLANGEDDVRLRFTAVDPVAEGAPRVTEVFRVDNNAAPFSSLGDASAAGSLDVYGGLPISFSVSDPEGDGVRVVVQWRRLTEGFVDVSGFSGPELVALSEDPEARALYRICTEVERWFTGRMNPIGPATVRLPNLANEGSTLLGAGLAGRTLQVLRPQLPLQPASTNWATSAVSAPVGVEVLDAGETALVLDRAGGAGWQLREIELTSGALVREVASGNGEAQALATLPDRTIAYVASADGGGWRLDRVDLDSGAVLGTAAVASSGVPRGVAALGERVALLTVDDTVLRVSFALEPGTAHPVASGLTEPWGIVVDRLAKDRALVAERANDRVLALNLRTGGTHELPAERRPGVAGPAFPAPTALALERGGTSLLAVVSDRTDGTQLAVLPLRVAHDHDDDGTEESVAYRIADLPADAGEAVAAGPIGTRVVAAAASGELLVGGGIQQRRVVIEWVPERHEATVDAAFSPPLTGRERWRLRDDLGAVPASPTGTQRHFYWDSRDAGDSGDVQFRLFPVDTETGIVAESSQPRAFRSALDVGSVDLVGGSGASSRVTHGDVDGDGDLDLLLAFRDPGADEVRLQTTRGTYETVALPPEFGNVGALIRTGDVDGDGDLDLITPGETGLEILTQETPGVFAAAPLVLPYPTSPNVDGDVADAAEVEVADLDGDGDLDFVTANHEQTTFAHTTEEPHFGDSSLTIWLQDPPGTWTPQVLGDEATSKWPLELEVADLDQDGDLDVAVACAGCLPSPILGACSSGEPVARALVFTQTAAGAFDPMPLVVGDPEQSAHLSGISSGDVDGDGVRDLITSYAKPLEGSQAGAQGYAQSVLWHRQSAPGLFELATEVLSLGSGFVDVTGGSLADLDADGRAEVVVNDVQALRSWTWPSPGATPEVTVLPLQEVVALNGAAGDVRSRRPEVADLDGDGDADVLGVTGTSLGASDEDHCAKLLGQAGGFGPFSTVVQVLAAPELRLPRALRAVDLDGDGLLEVLNLNYDTSFIFPDSRDTLTVHRQTAPREFQLVASLGGTSVTPGLRGYGVGDLDGDGDLDLACRATTELWFRQLADGSFEPTPVDFGLPAGASSGLTLGDYDGDGAVDVATLRDTEILVARQSAPGEFTTLASVPLLDGAAPETIATADLDGDGDDDLVALVTAGVGQSTFTLQFVLQAERGLDGGAPPFELPPLGLSDNFTPRSIDVADLDGDGDADVVLHAHLTTDEPTVVLIQTAPFTFDVRTSFDSSPNTNTLFSEPTLSLGDFDGDGDLDVTQNRLSGALEQLAPGWFSPRVEVVAEGAGSSARGALLEDIDRDGAPDFVFTMFNSDDLRFAWGGQPD